MRDRLTVIVPARAGSRGLPGKNWLDWGGKSLVQHTIETALACPYVKQVGLSSDDPRAPETAFSLGVDFIPRSEAAASDSATANDVVREVMSIWPPAQESGAIFLYLQPTSPLRNAEDITKAFESMVDADADACVSVSASPVCGYKILGVNEETGTLSPLFGNKFATGNRDELPKTYVANGAIYLFTRAAFLAHGSIPISGAAPFVMRAEDSVDIDSAEDFRKALNVRGMRDRNSH